MKVRKQAGSRKVPPYWKRRGKGAPTPRLSSIPPAGEKNRRGGVSHFWKEDLITNRLPYGNSKKAGVGKDGHPARGATGVWPVACLMRSIKWGVVGTRVGLEKLTWP